MGSSLTETAGLSGLEVVTFESRRAEEMATLIGRYGGIPRVAPSLREIPLEDNPAVFRFGEILFSGGFDAVIFMTGVGTRTLFDVLESRFPRVKVVRALSQITVVARGPKPVRVLRELQVPITITVPEPNTWREILQELDENSCGFTLEGSRVAVQEYGVSNELFLQELGERGAEVHRMPVYRWSLPEDTAPLHQAVEAIADRRVRVVLFTNAAQVHHMFQVASQTGLRDSLLRGFATCVVGSVGPTCSEAIRSYGLSVDLEPEHPRMGALVNENRPQSRRPASRKG